MTDSILCATRPCSAIAGGGAASHMHASSKSRGGGKRGVRTFAQLGGPGVEKTIPCGIFVHYSILRQRHVLQRVCGNTAGGEIVIATGRIILARAAASAGLEWLPNTFLQEAAELRDAVHAQRHLWGGGEAECWAARSPPPSKAALALPRPGCCLSSFGKCWGVWPFAPHITSTGLWTRTHSPAHPLTEGHTRRRLYARRLSTHNFHNPCSASLARAHACACPCSRRAFSLRPQHATRRSHSLHETP